MNKGINTKKIGRVIATKELIEQSYASARCFFSHFFPIEAHDAGAGCIEYIGYCRHFDETNDGEEIPQYDLLFERKNGRARFVKALKA